MHGEDTQGDAKTLHSGLRTYLFLLSPSQLQVSVDPLLNLICQPHSEDLILILPDYSNSSAGFFFFLPRALKTDSHPYFLPLTIIPAEQASASAFRRNQTSDQLGTLWCFILKWVCVYVFKCCIAFFPLKLVDLLKK